MAKPFTSQNGITELACKRWAARNGVTLRAVLPSAEPQLYEVCGVLVFFGDKLRRVSLAMKREVHHVRSLEQFIEIIQTKTK